MPEQDAALRRQLSDLMGDVRLRYWHRKTPFMASEQLIEVDREVRDALALPESPELTIEIERLTARLHALDPR